MIYPCARPSRVAVVLCDDRNLLLPWAREVRAPFLSRPLHRLSGWSISLIVLAICLTGAQRCEARAAERADIVAAATQPSPLPQAPEPSVDNGQDEMIIVTARRWGQVEIASETELDEDRIAAYGANSIGELINDISPLIGGTRDTPILLVNGRRIGSSTEITGYPPEALSRVAILPPEAAAHYGYPTGQRVVNLELKKNFASTDVDAGASMPMAGGRIDSQLSAGRSVIDGDTRWNAQLRGGHDTGLLKSQRDIPIRPDVIAILPQLEGEAGQAIDPNRFESVVAKVRSLALYVGVMRPVGDFALSLNANAGLDRSAQRTGLPLASIILPAVGQRDILYRLVSDRPLESRQRSTNFGVSASLSGPIAGWQSSLSISYSNSRNSSANDQGYDSSLLQQRVDAGDPSFDPSDPWPSLPLLVDRNRSNARTLGATFNTSKSILKLPAGEAGMSVTVNASQSRSRFDAVASSTGTRSQESFASKQIDGRWSLTIPVANRALGVLAPLGDLGLDLSMELGKASRTGTRHKWDVGGRWSPYPSVDFRASFGRENVEPLFEQLHGPRIEVVTRLFDFAQQEYVQPISIFGGNPNLAGGSIRNLSLSATVRPFAGDLATFTIDYRRRVARGGIASLPVLTPDVEAVFPERVTRDAGGRLIAIDMRPINILHDRTESIASGVTLLYTARPKVRVGEPPLPGSPRPWTFSLSIAHNWQLASEMAIRSGLPVLDRLRDSGQPQHNVTFNLVAGRRGMGVSLNGNWNGSARVRSNDVASGAAEFRYPSSAVLNLGFFAEPERWMKTPEAQNWASKLRISLDVQNITNGYRKVRVLGGTAVRELARDEIDPLGRTIRLSVRKQF